MDTKEQKPEMTRECETWQKHEWVLMYAIDEATTAIPMSVLVDINQILENNHGCASKEERYAAMCRPEDFQDGEVWLMVKLGDTNPARLLVKRSLEKLDAEALGAEHTHICRASGMDHMTKAQKMQLILGKLETNGRSSPNRQNGRGRREPAAISYQYTTCVKQL